MRKLPIDIIEEMKIRFNSEFDFARKILSDYIIENEYLDCNRIIRCVLFLTENGIGNWKSNLNAAKSDPRDVLFWAEYDDCTSKNPKRIRDFNKTFKENKI